MDSVSQFVLGAAVAAAALGPRVSGRRAATWGGIVATLPDLDLLISHGDAIADMTMHRGASHALFWMTVASPAAAFAIAALHRERHLFGRWWLAVWLAWITHALLDALTIYGTRLWLPFDATPVAIGNLFVVDPLYTLPLLVATLVLWVSGEPRRQRRATWWGLGLSTAYAVWGLGAQAIVRAHAERSLVAVSIATQAVVVSPAPLQTLLWRVVAIDGERAFEGYASVFDDARPIEFVAIDRGVDLLARVADYRCVQQLRGLAGSAVAARRDGDQLLLVDLRMGAEPDYVFTFPIATFGPGGRLDPIAAPARRPFRPDLGNGLPWLWQRMWGGRAAPPRSGR